MARFDADQNRRFSDRQDAGRQLAAALSGYDGDVVVLGLPRGGVPVAFEVARALRAPLDVLVVRKLGAPFHHELGMGAVSEGGVAFVNRPIVRHLGVEGGELAAIMAREAEEVERRVQRFRGGRPPLDVEGRAVILVDDGIATGGTVRAAIEVLLRRGARSIVLAVPVAAPETLANLAAIVDDVVCLSQPYDMAAIGAWYDDFTQVDDAEVSRLLELARQPPEVTPAPPDPPAAPPV